MAPQELQSAARSRWPPLQRGSVGCSRRAARSGRGSRRNRPDDAVSGHAGDAGHGTLDVYAKCRLACRLIVETGRPGQDQVIRAGALEELVSIMKIDVHLQALETLELVLDGNLEGVLRFLQLGGLPLLLPSLPGQADMATSIFRILRSVVVSGSTLQDTAGAAGVPDAIVGAMVQHDGNEDLQLMGCLILKELAAFHDINQERVVHAGAIPIVLAAMARYESSARMQALGCGVLRNITASNAEYQNEVVSRGAVPQLLRAMEAHKDVAAVQWASCWLLFCLSVHNDNTKDVVAAHGCEAAVFEAMARHRLEPRVQEACCWCLKEWAGQLQSLLLAVQHVLKALETHSSAPRVKAAIVAAMKHLSIHDTDGRVASISLARSGRLGRRSTRTVLTAIQE